jgi:hypothetical protein
VFPAAAILALLIALLPSEVASVRLVVRVILIVLIALVAALALVLDSKSDRIIRFYIMRVIQRAREQTKLGSLTRCATDETNLRRWLIAEGYGQYASRSLARQIRIRGLDQ